MREHPQVSEVVGQEQEQAPDPEGGHGADRGEDEATGPQA